MRKSYTFTETALICLMILFSANTFAQDFFQTRKMVSNFRTTQQYYGYSSAISGNSAMVGAKWDNLDLNQSNLIQAAGSVYFLEKGAAGWTQQKVVASDRYLYNNDNANGSMFGSAVSISGDIAVVGAPTEDYDSLQQNPIINAGAVYVFERNQNGVWVEKQKIVARDRAQVDWFGSAVAVSGNYIIVGSYQDDEDASGANSLNNSGSAYIFEKNGNGRWIQVEKIVANDRLALDNFGWTVSISEDGYAIVGAYGQDLDENGLNKIADGGAAYIFKRDVDGNWIQSQKIVSPEREYSGRYGMSVDIDKDRCIVGADFENELPTMSCGSAYIYERSGNNYVYVQKIRSSDKSDFDSFGRTVSISGDYVICAATGQDNDGNGVNPISNAGSVYAFKRSANGSWNQTQKITPSDRGTSDLFGLNMDLSTKTDTSFIVGVYYEDEDENGANTLQDAGSAYLFKLCNPTHSQSYTTSCYSYTSPSGRYNWTISGNYSDTLVNINGCDSIISINLTINNRIDTSIIVSTCGSYNFNDVDLTVSGTYADTLISIWGCDSIINLDLTIIPLSDTTLNESVCGSYLFNNVNIDISGTYYDTIQNIAGCDSLITLNLTINKLPKLSFDISQDSICNSNADILLNATPSGGIFSGMGVNDSIFSPTLFNGEYVIITYTYTDLNSCMNSIVDSIYVDVCSGIEEDNMQNVYITNDPSRPKSIIINSQNVSIDEISVSDILGKRLKTEKATGKYQNIVDLSEMRSGTYVIAIKIKESILKYKVILP